MVPGRKFFPPTRVLLRCAWLIRNPDGKKMKIAFRLQTHGSRNGPHWRRQNEKPAGEAHPGRCLRQGPQPTGTGGSYIVGKEMERVTMLDNAGKKIIFWSKTGALPAIIDCCS
jgi:hypothetical protein